MVEAEVVVEVAVEIVVEVEVMVVAGGSQTWRDVGRRLDVAVLRKR